MENTEYVKLERECLKTLDHFICVILVMFD